MNEFWRKEKGMCPVKTIFSKGSFPTWKIKHIFKWWKERCITNERYNLKNNGAKIRAVKQNSKVKKAKNN